MPPNAIAPASIEMLTGFVPDNLALYRRALTHRSHVRGTSASHLATNERLEFLGDALLGFVVAETLHREFPSKPEGFLTRLRAKLVSGAALAGYARRIDLGAHLILSANAEREGGRDTTSILADAYEALIGALYLDHDLGATTAFIHRTALDPIDLPRLAARNQNYKSQLLEYAQARDWPQPTYRTLSAEGPPHDRTFTVEACIGEDAHGQGTAGSKKKAEQQAAREALAALQEATPGQADGTT